MCVEKSRRGRRGGDWWEERLDTGTAISPATVTLHLAVSCEEEGDNAIERANAITEVKTGERIKLVSRSRCLE